MRPTKLLKRTVDQIASTGHLRRGQISGDGRELFWNPRNLLSTSVPQVQVVTSFKETSQ